MSVLEKYVDEEKVLYTRMTWNYFLEDVNIVIVGRFWFQVQQNDIAV